MNVFDLAAKITLDDKEYNSKLDGAFGKLQSVGSKIGSGLATAAKVGAAAVGVASTAVVALTKQAVDNFAEFEQLSGGTKLLFGDAYDFVMKKSQEAYKNVQMSQNEYLQQVNGFSTGLKESLGGNEQAAAELADRIITAEADIVAATGNSQEAVQNAFNGIMKNNFMMLDNLQLGIKPSKEGMQEVIDKMNEWNAAQGHATKYQMDNLADMQSALVDYIEYVGMSSYAQNEAAETIQGSLSMVKSAWSNLLTAIGEGDTSRISDTINNLVESAQAFGENIMPVVERALVGIVQLIGGLAPQIAAMIPKLVTEIVPTIINAGMDVLSAFSQALIDNLDTLIDSTIAIIQTIGQGLVDNLPQIIEAVVQLITTIGETLTDPTNLQMLLETGMAILETIVQSIIDNLPTLIEAALQIILNLVEYISENLDTVVQAAIDIIMAIAQALLENLPLLISAAIDIVVALASALIENIPTVLDAILKIIEGILTTIIKSLPKMAENGVKIVESIIGGIVKMLGSVIEMGIKLVETFIDGIVGAGARIMQAGKDMIGKFKDSVYNIINTAKEWGKDLIENFIGGIKDKISKVKETAEDIAGTIKSVLGFSEPDEGPLSNFHTYAPDMMNLFIKGIKDNEKRLQDQVAKSFDFGDITMKTTPAVSAKGGMAGTNNMTINVYGAEGQDVRELADIVQDRILHMMNQTGAVYA